LIHYSFAQNEAKVWYFGENAGVQINEDGVNIDNSGALNTKEGCATICDKYGSLLFYTDGSQVWNRTHSLMKNGDSLNGHTSSTQSAIIIPQPGTENIYYIFTVDAIENNLHYGVSYSIVDIYEELGKGKVISKNLPLFSPSTEKITAVSHLNNHDIWLICHKWNSNSFYAYLVTDAGITQAAVKSNVGLTHSGGSSLSPLDNAIGYMKVSPVGSKIALGLYYSGVFQLFDFDNETGSVSNPITLTDNNKYAYGVEFSPTGKYLYTTTIGEIKAQIVQYDLSSNNEVTIQNSAFKIYESENKDFGGLQLAHNGKIYMAVDLQPKLGIINYPDSAEDKCKFKYSGLSLSGHNSRWGLPTFVQSFFYPNFFYENICFGDTTFFKIPTTYRIDSFLWDFDDTASYKKNYSKELYPTHYFTSAGNYQVKLLMYKKDYVHVLTKEIKILPRPEFSLGSDTTTCRGSSIILQANAVNADYLWSNNSYKSFITVHNAGTYCLQLVSYPMTLYNIM